MADGDASARPRLRVRSTMGSICRRPSSPGSWRWMSSPHPRRSRDLEDDVEMAYRVAVKARRIEPAHQIASASIADRAAQRFRDAPAGRSVETRRSGRRSGRTVSRAPRARPDRSGEPDLDVDVEMGSHMRGPGGNVSLERRKVAHSATGGSARRCCRSFAISDARPGPALCGRHGWAHGVAVDVRVPVEAGRRRQRRREWDHPNPVGPLTDGGDPSIPQEHVGRIGAEWSHVEQQQKSSGHAADHAEARKRQRRWNGPTHD